MLPEHLLQDCVGVVWFIQMKLFHYIFIQMLLIPDWHHLFPAELHPLYACDKSSEIFSPVSKKVYEYQANVLSHFVCYHNAFLFFTPFSLY